MNKETILQLNVIPEGQQAWLTYDQYQQLKTIFESLPLPVDETGISHNRYFTLSDLLTNIAQLSVPMNEAALHLNAFTLIRRGYAIEEITAAEYAQLVDLMAHTDQADIDDMALYETGPHRDLYTFLTRKLGLSVKPGRGPVWHRAKALLDHHQASLAEKHQPQKST